MTCPTIKSNNTSFVCVCVLLSYQMWPDLIQKAKDGGLDAIETYIFWNAHEPRKGQVYIILKIYKLYKTLINL